MPRTSIINQATKLVATLKQQGHAVKAMEIDGDSIRVEFAVNNEDFDDYNELDFIDWRPDLKK